MTYQIITAFTLGLLGSLHCMAMCGPLLLSLAASRKNNGREIFSSVLHHSGRITAYIMMGILLGTAGQGLISAGNQQIVSIITGILLLMTVLLPGLTKKSTFLSGVVMKFWGRFKSLNTMKGLFVLGLLNGFLPCGLVYAALALAVNSGSTFSGSVTMLSFGLGTLPLLLVISLSGAKIRSRFPKVKKNVLPAVTVLMASLLITRGMNLGIPYLSPEVKPQGEISCCCENE